MMESACKQLVGAMLKDNDRPGSESGALAMPALIGQRIDHTRSAFWASPTIYRVA